MLDILLFAERYDSRIDWDYIHGGLKAADAEGFYDDLVVLGNMYLGFEFEGKHQTCPDELLNDMFRMGTFGNTNSIDTTAGKFIEDMIRSDSIRDEGKDKKFRGMVQRVFPKWNSWTSWKPYLKDKPWMVVPEWFWRVGRYLRHETSMGSMEEINESYSIAEHRLELLKKYKVV